MSVVDENGRVRLLPTSLIATRAKHAAFALGLPLEHKWGMSNGPSVSSIAMMQPYGAIAVTFMINVATFEDVQAQLSIWRQGLPFFSPHEDLSNYPPSCFFTVGDDVMETIRSNAVVGFGGGGFTMDECSRGGTSQPHSQMLMRPFDLIRSTSYL